MAEERDPLDEAERRFVAAAREVVRQRIRDNGGWLPFEEYMDTCLNHPTAGYYGAWVRGLGADGDFVTAPELGDLFSRVVAGKLAPLVRENGGGFLEIGAGSGKFTRRMAEAARGEAAGMRAHRILETSAPMRRLQATTLGELVRAADIRWIDSIPAGFSGVAFANEVVDALPCSIFRRTGDGWAERGVAIQGDEIVWSDRCRDPGNLPRRLGKIEAGEGYLAEVNLRGEALVRSVLEGFDRGVLVIVDYGFRRAELHHPQRSCGTLMCHRRHRAFSDPLRWPGICDITTHVDFTGLAQAAREVGGSVLGFCDLSDFLLDTDALAGLVEDLRDAPAGDTRAAELKRLLMPHEMGQLFKVLALGVGDTVAPAMGRRPRNL